MGERGDLQKNRNQCIRRGSEGSASERLHTVCPCIDRTRPSFDRYVSFHTDESTKKKRIQRAQRFLCACSRCVLVLRAAPPRAADGRLARGEDRLPEFVALAVEPMARAGIALKVAIDVAEALFEQLEEGIAECRVHSDHFAWMVAAHIVTGEGFLEEGCVHKRDKESVHPSISLQAGGGGKGGGGRGGEKRKRARVGEI